MTFSKKSAAVPITLAFACILIRWLFLYSAASSPLNGFCEELTLDILTDNPLELHYSIAYPEQIGLSDISKNLIPFSDDYYAKSKSTWTQRAEILAEITPATNHTEDVFLHQLLTHYIDLELQSLEFPYYENPLACSGGVHSQLPILLSEYTFRSKKDIENYFTLLSQIPAYLKGIAEYAKNQEQQDIFLYQENLTTIQKQCLELFPKNQLQNNTHFLQTSFQERLQPLIDKKLLSEKEAESYTQQNTSLLINTLLPAYQSLAVSVSNLTGTPDLTGLSTYPLGKEYYEFLLEANTGSSRSVDELFTMLYDRYEMLFKKYVSLLQKNTFLSDWTFPLETPTEMLQHLYTQSQQYFPSLQQLNPNNSQQIQLKTVDGILTQSSAPAFYMTPPIDANTEHSIYINPDAEMESMDLYTTLAHEGFPGHLYQTVYSQTALNQTKAPLIRHLLYYGGFTEGWAVYAELYSYDFIIQNCDQSVKDTILLSRYNREIQLCLCSILDIFIHYQGADLDEVETLFTSLGLNSSFAEDIYASICDAPANYPKYYIGYLEILTLKEKAKKLWGENFSDFNFHKWLLETGGGDFTSLSEYLATTSS